jgi:hypothetical protein
MFDWTIMQGGGRIVPRTKFKIEAKKILILVYL